MHNKISLLIKLSITFYSVLVTCFVFCQNTTTSPYSSFGLGQRDELDNANFIGLGNTTITYFDSTTLNYFNPSSYNSLSKGQPLFSTAISSRLSLYNEGDRNYFTKSILLNHFSMGFSFAKFFGFSFGLKPFSRRGYEITTKQVLFTDSILQSYIGSGSSNEAFFGFSSNIFKLKKQELSIGANLGYVFGSLINERRSNIIGSTIGGIDQKTLKINSLHYEFGINYKLKINNSNSILLSGVVEPNQLMKAYQKSELFSSNFIDNPLYYDKLDSTGYIKGTISIPTTSTFGFNYLLSFKDIKRDAQTRNSEISFHSSYKITNWKDYKTSFSNDNLINNYVNTSKYTFGIQYIPEKSFLQQVSTISFLETIRYRFGYYQYNLPILGNQRKINDYGATFGFGIPIRVQKSLSSINIGFSIGQQSNGNEGDLKEFYTGINVGIVFAPANFEHWFIKRKLD